MKSLTASQREFTICLLLDATRTPFVTPDKAAQDEALEKEAEAVFCAACGSVVTKRSEKTEREGSFEHVFVNPAGIVYRIGCFNRAAGCREAGARTEYYSWFPGFRWSIALCIACKTHLGWFFSREGSAADFFALILERLNGY